MKEKIAGYLLNIDSKKISCYEKTKIEVNFIKETFKIKDMSDISDLNYRSLFTVFFFKTLKSKDKFISLYESTKASLSNFKKTKDIKCVLNKRLYLIMTLMKYKTYTDIKKEIKDIQVGDAFYLYDQKSFILVKLVKYTLLENEDVYKHRYEYKLA